MEAVPSCTLDELIWEVRQYRPPDVLSAVRDWSEKLEDYTTRHGNQPMFVRLPKRVSYHGLHQTIAVTHHFLTMIAKLSLLNGHVLSSGSMNEDRFLRLLRMATELYDPADKGQPEKIIFREINKQAPYQEEFWQAIPRALLLYLDANARLPNPEFDIDAEFKAHFGLDVRTFLTLGFLLYAQFISERAFYPLLGWRSTVPAVRELGIMTRENVEALLRLVAADQQKFKDESLKRAASGTGNDQYDWNAFFKFPVIDIGNGNHVLPLSRLLIYRLHDAPFHELADLHQGQGGENPFRAFFGNVFQEYIGLLLDDAFPSQAQREAGGPPVDWLVRVRDAALLIECRSQDFKIETKSKGDRSLIEHDLGRIARDVVEKLPRKKESLASRALEFGLEDAQSWHYLVVVRNPLVPVPLVRAKIDSLLTRPVPYHLLSVGDFEQLLALEDTVGVERVLADKAQSPDELGKDFRSFFHERRNQYRFRRNPLLQRTFDAYFEGLLQSRRPGPKASPPAR